jgi:hypothetical protein
MPVVVNGLAGQTANRNACRQILRLDWTKEDLRRVVTEQIDEIVSNAVLGV